jgi:hypothetical protein
MAGLGPKSACTLFTAAMSSNTSTAVQRRQAAFRNGGWAVKPVGAVSYRLDTFILR